MRVSYAIVFVSDMQRSVAFYRDLIGLPLGFESPGWRNSRPRVPPSRSTRRPRLAMNPRPRAERSQDNAGGPCRAGSRSVSRTHGLDERAVRAGAKTVFGAHVAEYADPDGLVFSMGEDRRRAEFDSAEPS
jgi:catechol 2,3-dioxygenase-like lactoylglutathione lyase family enzyme